MNPKNNLSRITIDIPKEEHKKLKAKAAMLGRSMREIILEAIGSIDECLNSDHYPNKKTINAIKEAKSRKGLITGKEA